MKLDSLVTMHGRHPIQLLGETPEGKKPLSITEKVGSVVLWGAGLFGTIWLARWYTLRTLRTKGVIP
jgi:hypothetical protein